MDLSTFPEPPEELIAQEPRIERDAARLMVLDRGEGSIRNRLFRDLPGYFRSGDVLVLNDVRVFPARLVARKPTGGRVRLLLLGRDEAGDRWTSLLTPAQKPGARLLVGDFEITVERKREDAEYELAFSRPLTDVDLDRLGRMPLPPYIRRRPDDAPEVETLDREFYQTVFSSPAGRAPATDKIFSAPGAVAAPTAGLHFTSELLDRIAAQGADVRRVRLDVGWGTFRPMASDDYSKHRMMAEGYFIPAETAEAVNRAKSEKRRVWAVGTTAVRALEGSVDLDGRVPAGPGATDVFIHPGCKFRVVDVLVTNFHLRRHTPLLLAAAFAGGEFLKRAYEEAIRERYRFFSYGDAMLIV
jgi:S-adenosylmethionine:tRNA ribosyltransferase-isomerase